MAAVSSVITVGLLGTPSLVVTLGLSAGAEVTVKTACMVAKDIYSPGMKAGETYAPGLKTGQAGC